MGAARLNATLVRRRRINMDFATWSPFQSKQVREICAHMTGTERSRTMARGFGYGLWVFLTVGAIASGAWWANPALRITAGGLLAIHLCAVPFWQRRVRRLLCSTNWSREQGLTPQHLRLFEFRFWRSAA